MIELQSYYDNFLDLKKQVENLESLLAIGELKKDLIDLEEQMTHPGFWDKQNQVKTVTSKISSIKNKLQSYENCVDILDEVEISFTILKESNDTNIYDEIVNLIDSLSSSVEKLHSSTLLSREFDSKCAIVDINAGAGGTESQDWVEMLFRMYTRYCASNNFGLKVTTYHAGDPVGIKSISFEVSGENAFGLLKGERGVHRLIRISPFDSSGKRHTSFASVDVVPILDDIAEMSVDKSELKIDTYRASGAGGQSVNTTDSAVRITHLPTGIIVSCQNERSQLMNKEYAMRLLLNKLAAKAYEERQEKLMSSATQKSANAWGSQIRTYTFQPYMLVKDHRTNYEVGNVKDVLDGNIEPFIVKYLEFINNFGEV